MFCSTMSMHHSVIVMLSIILETLDEQLEPNDGFILEEDAASIKYLITIVKEVIKEFCENKTLSLAEIHDTFEELRALGDELISVNKELGEDIDWLLEERGDLRAKSKALSTDQDESAVDARVLIVESDEVLAERRALRARQEGVQTRLHLKKTRDLEERLKENIEVLNEILERRKDLENEYHDHADRLDEWYEQWEQIGRRKIHLQNRRSDYTRRRDELYSQIKVDVFDINGASSGFTVVPTDAGCTVVLTNTGFSVVPTSAGVTSASTSRKLRIASTTSSDGFAVWLSHWPTTDGFATSSLHVSSIEPTSSSTMATSSTLEESSNTAGSTATTNSS